MVAHLSCWCSCVPQAMPHIECKVDDKARLVFKVKPDPPPEEWRSTKMTIKISTREDVSVGIMGMSVVAWVIGWTKGAAVLRRSNDSLSGRTLVLLAVRVRWRHWLVVAAGACQPGCCLDSNAAEGWQHGRLLPCSHGVRSSVQSGRACLGR